MDSYFSFFVFRMSFTTVRLRNRQISSIMAKVVCTAGETSDPAGVQSLLPVVSKNAGVPVCCQKCAGAPLFGRGCLLREARGLTAVLPYSPEIETRASDY